MFCVLLALACDWFQAQISIFKFENANRFRNGKELFKPVQVAPPQANCVGVAVAETVKQPTFKFIVSRQVAQLWLDFILTLHLTLVGGALLTAVGPDPLSIDTQRRGRGQMWPAAVAFRRSSVRSYLIGTGYCMAQSRSKQQRNFESFAYSSFAFTWTFMWNPIKSKSFAPSK